MTKNWQTFEFCVPIQETLAKEKDFFIRGVAINETITRNGVSYVGEELEKATASLRGKPILKDHNNSVDSIVGRTTDNVMFNTEKKRIDFEAKIIDPLVQQKIKAGLITNVSIGAGVREFEENEEEGGAPIARGIEFFELSLVAVPGDPNAGILSALAESFNLSKEANPVKQKVVEEENKMAEPTMEDLKATKEKLEKEVAALEIAKLELKKEELSNNEAANNNVVKEEAEPEAKAEPAKEEPAAEVKDETKGEVAPEPAKEEPAGEENYAVTVSEYGGYALTDNAIYKKSVKMRR